MHEDTDVRALFSALRASISHAEKMTQRAKEVAFSSRGVEGWTRGSTAKFVHLADSVSVEGVADELYAQVEKLKAARDELEMNLENCIGSLEEFARTFRATIMPPPPQVGEPEEQS